MIGEIEGIKIYVNDGTYTKYKKTLEDEIDELQQENKQLKEDISFCLKSITQEMKMSTDSRTRSEMTSCYEILKGSNE